MLRRVLQVAKAPGAGKKKCALQQVTQTTLDSSEEVVPPALNPSLDADNVSLSTGDPVDFGEAGSQGSAATEENSAAVPTRNGKTKVFAPWLDGERLQGAPACLGPSMLPRTLNVEAPLASSTHLHTVTPPIVCAAAYARYLCGAQQVVARRPPVALSRPLSPRQQRSGRAWPASITANTNSSGLTLHSQEL